MYSKTEWHHGKTSRCIAEHKHFLDKILANGLWARKYNQLKWYTDKITEHTHTVSYFTHYFDHVYYF